MKMHTISMGTTCACAILCLTVMQGIAAEKISKAKGTPLQVEAHLGMPAVPIPQNNPMTREKVELGKMLYFDKRLSQDQSLSCATCHIPERGYAEPEPVSIGIHKQKGGRNGNPVVNSAYATAIFWDGRAKTLEEQAAGPIENPIEMGAKIEEVAKTLNGIPEYKKRFQDVFGKPADKETITMAIAAFERTLVSGNSPYDRFQDGDKSALSDDAQAGMTLFNGKALCSTCHTPPVFSSWNYYNAGVGVDKAEPDPGRMKVTNQAVDKCAFRVPALREAEITGPYFHDGNTAALEDAVKFMAGGGKDNPNLHPLFRAVKAQNLSEGEVNQLVAFVMSLSGEYPIVEEPKLP